MVGTDQGGEVAAACCKGAVTNFQNSTRTISLGHMLPSEP